MRGTHQICACFKSITPHWQRHGTLLGLIAVAHVADAQSVLMPPPAFAVSPPALQQFQAEEQGVIKSSAEVAALGFRTLLGQWGPVTLHPHAYYRFSYADGIESSPGDHQATIIHELAPGMLFVIGQHWS